MSVTKKSETSMVLTRPYFNRRALLDGNFPPRLPDRPWVIWDVDGTLVTYVRSDGLFIRKPYDESRVLLDVVIEFTANMVRAMYETYNVCIVSGRHDLCGDDTCKSLEAYGIPFDYILMRHSWDSRPDYEIKAEILKELDAVIGKENIAFVFDDRPQVVRMWKENGLRVIPVRGTDKHRDDCPTFLAKAKGYITCLDCGALEDF